MSSWKKIIIGYRPKGRKPQHEPVGFQERLPLSLKNKVSGRGSKLSTAICLEEMAVMLACLKGKEFSEAGCSKEITTFEKCVAECRKAAAAEKASDTALGTSTTGIGNSVLNAKQINNLLKRFPHPK